MGMGLTTPAQTAVMHDKTPRKSRLLKGQRSEEGDLTHLDHLEERNLTD